MAEAGDGAAGAFRADGVAAGLAEADEVGVPRLPVADGQDFAQFHFGLDRRARVDEFEPIADAVDVYIDADRREVEADRDGEIRRLAPDAREFAKFLHRARQDAAEARAQDLGERLQMFRLVAVEADGIDEFFDFLSREPVEVFGRERL